MTSMLGLIKESLTTLVTIIASPKTFIGIAVATFSLATDSTSKEEGHDYSLWEMMDDRMNSHTAL